MRNIIEGAVNDLFNRIGLLNDNKRTTIIERVETCRSCESLYFDESIKTLRCGECKCFIRWKASNLNEKCPLGKWKV